MVQVCTEEKYFIILVNSNQVCVVITLSGKSYHVKYEERISQLEEYLN